MLNEILLVEWKGKQTKLQLLLQKKNEANSRTEEIRNGRKKEEITYTQMPPRK